MSEMQEMIVPDLPTSPRTQTLARRTTTPLALVATTLALAGCVAGAGGPDNPFGPLFASSSPTLPVRVMNTPKVAEAAQYRRIAIGTFERDQGQQLTQQLEAALGKATIGGRQAYEIVPSAQVAALLRGQALGDARAREVVAQTRTDAVLYGDANYAFNRRPYTQTERQCAQQDPAAAKRLFNIGGCKTYRDVNVACSENEAVVTAQLRVFDTKKGAIVFADRVEGRASDNVCGPNARKPDAQLVSEAVRIASERMRLLVAAGETVVPVRLMSESDGDVPAGAKQDFANGLEFAKGNRVDAACERFEAAFNTEKGRSVPIVYNWAVCLEAQGNLLDANEQYAIAERASGKPLRLVTDGINRTQGALASRDALKRQRPDLMPGGRSAAPGTVQPVSVAPPADVAPVVAPSPAPTSIAAPAAVSPDLARTMLTERRVALVVGNARYRDPEQALRNPVNDAEGMRLQLLRLKFDVVTVRDGSLAELDRAVREFAGKAAGAGVALFFYSGHGFEDGRENWLIPVEFDFRNRGAIAGRALPVGQVMSTIAQAAPRVGVAVVDACALPWSVTQAAARSTPPRGTIVAWATSPGSAADDNRNRRNGFYTERLLQRIATPNQPVEQLFEAVRADVIRDSNRQQQPWVASALVTPLYFNVAAR